MTKFLEQLRTWYQQHSDRLLNDFYTFLRFESISTDKKFEESTRKTAQWLVHYLTQCGLDTQLWETEGLPAVFASCMRAGPERPTLLIYHHYDVQPVDPLELWDSPPFQPVMKENQIFARGAQDNKGQCFYSINAVCAFLELVKECKVNIKIFIEGEEETGSRGTFALLPQKKEQLRADYLLVVDTGIPAPGVPAITLGTRGITTLHVEVQNAHTDLHSGEHGGIALNPLRALSQVLARMWDENGKVVIPNFYRDVNPVSEEELKLYDLEFNQAAYQKTFGVKVFAPEPGFGPAASNWLRPTLEINGIHGGYSGPGFKTVLPAKAIANISARLVPNQNPDQIAEAIRDFLISHLPKDLDVKVELHHGGKAYRCAYPSTLATICSDSYQAVFQQECKLHLCGGSIPIVSQLAAVSGAQALLMGVGLADDQIHAPNEHFGWDRFEQGFLVMGEILNRLAHS